MCKHTKIQLLLIWPLDKKRQTSSSTRSLGESARQSFTRSNPTWDGRPLTRSSNLSLVQSMPSTTPLSKSWSPMWRQAWARTSWGRRGKRSSRTCNVFDFGDNTMGLHSKQRTFEGGLWEKGRERERGSIFFLLWVEIHSSAVSVCMQLLGLLKWNM